MLLIVNPHASTVSPHAAGAGAARAGKPLRGRGRGHARAGRRDHALRARPPPAATTWWWRSAATAPSTKPPTACSAPPPRSRACPAARRTCSAKLLGIPGDLLDATEHLLALADDWRQRRVDLGVVNGRCFTFNSGLGLDAMVVEQVDSNPHLKARLGPYYYSWVAVSTFLRRYLRRPPRLRVQAGGQHARRGHRDHPERRHLHLLPGPPDRHRRGRPSSTPGRSPGASAPRRRCCRCCRSPGGRSRPARASAATARSPRWAELQELTVRTADGRPLPLQADGDFLGEVAEARYSILPDALNVVC